MNMFNTTTPENSYIFGFFQSDGHLQKNTRNRGKLTLEISDRDKDILPKIQSILPVKSIITTRTRDTNFKLNYTSHTLSIYDWQFRTCVNKLGLPYGKKSNKICPPADFIERDYYRGLIDGDGSLGITGKGLPFIALVTDSESIANSYLAMANKTTNKQYACNRNTRDNIYNIAIFREEAQEMTRYLYYKDCLCLSRKEKKASDVLSWVRPASLRKRDACKKWTSYQDEFILNNTIEKSIKKLDRSKKSIQTRLWRLSNHNF